MNLGHRHMNVILDSLSHKNFNLLKNYSSSTCNPIIIHHEKIEDFVEFPFRFDSAFYVLKNSTTVYSLYKISPNSKNLEIEIIPIEEFSQSLK